MEYDQSATTTARELADEMNAHLDGLRTSADKLRAETKAIDQNRDEIKEELTATLTDFVQAEMSQLKGIGIERFDALAMSVPELGAQSLAYARSKMFLASDQATKAFLDLAPNCAGPADIQRTLEQERTTVKAAAERRDTENDRFNAAEAKYDAFRQSAAYGYVQFAREVAEQGGIELTSANNAYYRPKSALGRDEAHSHAGRVIPQGARRCYVV
jgi:hypothetical protein